MGAFDFKGITDVNYSAQAQAEQPIETLEQAEQVAQPVQQSSQRTTEDLNSLADEDLFAHYGVNGRISYSDLNAAMRNDKLHTEKQYAVQQAWFNARQKEIDSIDPITRKKLQEKLDGLKAKPSTFKEFSHLGNMAERFGSGVDSMQSGAANIAADALSHLDKSDAEIDEELKKEHPEKFSKYQSSQAKYDKIAQSIVADPANINLAMSGNLDKMVRKRMSKEELADLDWYNESHNTKRVGAMYSEKSNAMTKYFSKSGLTNMIEANKKSQYAGAEERKQAILQAGEKADGVFSSAWETAKAAVLDPFVAVGVGLESTGSQLIPQLAGLAAMAATRSPMAYQFVSSLGGFPAEVQGAIAEKMAELAHKKYKRGLGELNEDELLGLVQENQAEFSKAMDKGLISATATMMTETPVAKGVGLVASGFRKLATNPATKSAVLKGFGITGEAVTKFTGEGWEEAFGQIAANIATGEPWDEGVGQSFVLALTSLEQAPNIYAISKDVKNILGEQATEQPTAPTEQGATPTEQPTEQGATSTEQTTEQTPTPTEIKTEPLDPRYKRAGDVLGFLERNHNGEYVNESGEPVALLDPQGAIQQQIATYLGELKTLGTELGFDMETEDGRRAFADEVRKQNEAPTRIEIDGGVEKSELFQEFTDLEQQKQDPQSNKEAIEARQNEIRALFDVENVTADGEIITTNSFDTDYQNWTLTQGTNNESGSNNRNGSQDANGQTTQQGADVANSSGTQSSGETSEPIPPAQTETTTTGNSQSNSGATADLTQQPNNNPTTSGTVGLDGRTDQANGQRVEQGELGEQGGEQNREPTQTAQSGSTDSGVQQRTQSDSVGETLGVEDGSTRTNENNGIEPTTDSQPSQSESVGGNRASKPSEVKSQEPGANSQGATTSRTSDTPTQTGQAEPLSATTDTVENVRESKKAKDNLVNSYPRSFKSKDELMGFIRDLYKTDQAGAMQLVNDLMSEGSQLELRGKKASKKTKDSIYNAFYKDIRDGRAKTQQDIDREQAAKKQRIEDLIKRGNPIGFMDENLGLFTAGEKKALADELKGKLHSTQLSKLGMDLSPSEQLLNDYYIGANAKDRNNALKKGLTEEAWGKLPVEDRNKIINRLNNGAIADKLLSPKEVGFMVQNRLDGEAELNTRSYTKAMENYNKADVSKKDRLKQAVERSNDKLRRMNEAMAEPSGKDTMVDRIRNAGKVSIHGVEVDGNMAKLAVAHKLLDDDKSNFKEVFEAFKQAGGSPQSANTLRNGGWKVTENKTQHNTVVAKAVADKVARAGDLVKFDGTVERADPKAEYKRLEESTSTDDAVTVALAQQPKGTTEMVSTTVRQVLRAMKVNNAQKGEMFDAVELYAEKNNIDSVDGSTADAMHEALAWASGESGFMNWVKDKSASLHSIFLKLQKAISAVVAIVSVGAMTIPNDAMAQQGFAQYTQGQQISGVSQDASNTINWVVDNKDHKGKSFVVADKAKGVIHVVSPDGKVLNTQNALFGKGKGNSAVTGNTPSGRFALKKTDTKTLTKADQKAFGDSVLDLADPHTGRAITAEDGLIFAMHRVMNTPQRHKALNTATANDNYITNGCINIPTAFYDTAVDGLDGAMVYILDMPQTAKKASTRSQTKSVSNSSPTSDWSKPTMAKWSVKPATNVNELNPSLNNDKLQRVLEKSLGEFADKVTLISADEFENHKGFEKLKSNGIEGFYDPNTKQVAIVVDNIQEQDGLSANDRLAWVAWHELYHKGLDVKYGQDLDRVVSDMGTNPFIDNLAEAIMADRAMNSLASIDKNTAIQEALVELGAALQTKNLGGLKDRYGVNVPMALRDDVLGTLGKFLDRIKSLVGRVIGKPTVTTKQVEALLEDSIAYAKVGKADKEMVKSILDDFQEPTSAVSQSALFSANGISGKAKALWEKVFPRDLYYLFTGNDVGRVGTTPDRDTTKSMKAKRTKMNVRSRFHTLMNDSQQIIIDLDPQGDGGELSRSVANFSNKKNQLTRKWERKLKGLEMQFIEFAQKNKDIFKSRFDRKQVDDTVQSVTTALHAITDGNKTVRKNIEETIFGKDITLADGNVLHIDGLLDKVNQHKEYIANAQFNGIQVPSYTTKQFEHYQTQLNEMIAIQNKFDQDNYNILSNTNSQNKNRENWRGYDGLTFAEAEQKLKDFHKQGLLDNDVTDGLVKREYEVKKYIEVNGLPQVVKVKHYSYEVADVEKKAKGRIMPLVDAYVNLSHEMHQFTVDQIGEKRAGGKTSGKWEVSTMGKVEQIYSEQAKDSSGNPIDRLYDATVATNIDNIISMKHAAQYTGRRMGRATQGGTAMEQLAWRLSLTAQQAASKDIAVAMDKLHGSRPDLVKRYSQNDNEYAMVNGIVHEIPVLDKNGNPVLDNNGNPKTKLVKLSFADQEANAALFGDNLPSQEDSDAWFLFRAFTYLLKTATKFGAMSLTQTAGFAVNNAYKGFNEKLNQMMAWDKDHAFVKSIKDPKKRALFDGIGLKLHLMAQMNKIDPRGLPRLAAREKAALMFAQTLTSEVFADGANWLSSKSSFFDKSLKALKKGATTLFVDKMTQEEYAKLVEMYERGGISSRVEELMRQTQAKKFRYGFGKTLPKVVDGFYGMLETATTMTMSQELVSSLIMVDFLTNQVGMDRDVAIDANLHFMNFNKRGTSQMMNYLRKYTMFANAIAQGSRAFERSFFIQTNNEKDSVFGVKGVKWSKQGLYRTIRNVTMSIALHSFARLVAENICPDENGLGNQVGNLNEYQLLREIPISTGCNEYFRYPVEYGVGMVENAIGVGIVQVALGNWSAGQAGSFIMDALKDNASPIGLAMGDSDSAFGKVAFLLYSFIPEPLREPALAFGGVDQFGNNLNSSYVNDKYRPAFGKKTTDPVWHRMAEELYGSGMLGNLTPEEVRVLTVGWFRGAARDILTSAIEDDPKKTVWEALVGAGNVYREPKEMDTVAYTMVQNRLGKRYRDLVLYYNQAKVRDKVLPSKSWLSKNGYELDADDHKALELISQYFERMKNKRLDQETRFKYNVELLKGLKKIEGSE